MNIPRDVAQMLIEKLDRNLATVKETKTHAALFGVTLSGRTRVQVAREIGRAIEPTHYVKAVTGMDQRLTAKLVAGLNKNV